jgi:hypothetical protein
MWESKKIDRVKESLVVFLGLNENPDLEITILNFQNIVNKQ